jgi:hypothetical protein
MFTEQEFDLLQGIWIACYVHFFLCRMWGAPAVTYDATTIRALAARICRVGF